MTLSDICAALEMAVPQTCAAVAQTVFTGATMDNRAVERGDIFFCIKGEHADGHDFAAKAVEAGAACVVAERPLPAVTQVPVLVVQNSVKALGGIAHAWRDRFAGTLVVVTGSAGKTTVKEVLAHVLQQHAPTAKNELNRNNQIGMPLCLLRCTGEEQFWVMEAGISQPQDMDELGDILRPDVAVVLNVGGAHAEGLGDKGVAWYKARLLHYVRPGGMGFACADYADLAAEARKAMPAVRFFSGRASGAGSVGGASSATYSPVGSSASGAAGTDGASLYATYDGAVPSGMGLYTLHLGERLCRIEAPFRGSYGAENAIAIGAVAAALGVSDAEIRAAFATATLPQQRFQVRRTGAWIVVDDCYNANPLSMQRMLESAQELAQGKPLLAVMGAMGELGATAAAEHVLLGQRLAEAGVAAVCWRGGYVEEVEKGLRSAGSHADFCPVTTVEDFKKFWQTQIPAGGVVLCKGSRANMLEEFVRIMCGCEEK